MSKITEQQLLDGYDGIATCGAKISVVGGDQIWWDYRRDCRSQTDGCEPVCDADTADCITLENDRHGKIELDNSHNTSHPSIARIKRDEGRLFGDEA